MDSGSFHSSNPNGSFKAYSLAGVLLALSIVIITGIFLGSGTCRQHLESARYNQQNYGIAPSGCFQYFVNNALIPSLIVSLPFIFLAAVLFTKEWRIDYPSHQPKHEKIAFTLSISTVLILFLFLALVMSIDCEGFGCLGIAPLIALTIGAFPPLLFSFSLWYLKARYLWRNWQFLVVTISVVLLTLLAYTQTPLL